MGFAQAPSLFLDMHKNGHNFGPIDNLSATCQLCGLEVTVFQLTIDNVLPPCTKAVLVKRNWAHNINSWFGDLYDRMVSFERQVLNRFRLMTTYRDATGAWSVNFGIAFARNPRGNAAWRYELYLSLAFWTFRIGILSPKKVILFDTPAGKGYRYNTDAKIFEECDLPDQHCETEFDPDEANERA